MKAHLMFPDRDFDLKQDLPPLASALVQDLELTTLFAAMSGGDKFLAEVIPKAVLIGSADPATLLYPQAILRDCLSQEPLFRQIYALVVEAIESERKEYLGITYRYPNGILHRSVGVLEMLVGMLRRLRDIALVNYETVASEGIRALFAMLGSELDDSYIATVRQHLKLLRFSRGVLISAALGEGNKGRDYVLRRENAPEGNWFERMLSPDPPSYSFRIPDRDEGGARALSELRDRGINLVANAAAQSTDHILDFFKMLRTELAFYIGCMNLNQRLRALDEPVCFPKPAPPDQRGHSATGLYDVSLALTAGRQVVGNNLPADDRQIVIITGANQGGKSTFLRSVGQSQVMMQCGMFVAATQFEANVCERIFTHYKREEDRSMTSGKFDEELSRMSEIVDHLTPNSLVLFNESFASTNEREGSEIARQIVAALLEDRIKVFFVTHQFEFARFFILQKRPDVLFLRAERQQGGTRTFRITQGEPLPTSYGADLFARIFEPRAANAA